VLVDCLGERGVERPRQLCWGDFDAREPIVVADAEPFESPLTEEPLGFLDAREPRLGDLEAGRNPRGETRHRRLVRDREPVRVGDRADLRLRDPGVEKR